MASKRALIVDDSKSARTFLSRILEKYDIDVDTAESAEVAIEYLTRHRPDVIFMDHLMPGMDGFQAVQAIKNDPRTATIPIMMYTSQEGELYLGQARALGAVGVLPKQIRPADVSKVLYQIGLVPDRRSAEQTTFTRAAAGFRSVAVNDAVASPQAAAPQGSVPHEPAGGPVPDAAHTGAPPAPDARALIESTLREQVAELRRFVVSNLDNQSERLLADVRAMLRDMAPQPAVAAPLAEPVAAAPSRTAAWPWVVAILALVAGLAMGALWWREAAVRRDAEVSLAELRGELQGALAAVRAAEARAREAETRAAAQSAAAGPAGGNSADADAAAEPLMALVPYGELPFAGPRLESLRQLFARLRAQGFRGVVEVLSFPGRFCLVGNPTDGYSQAPEEMAYARCDVVGNPHDEGLSPAQRETLALANMAGELRNASGGAVEVRIEHGGAEAVATAYPAVEERLTAGAWNRAAVANNRIEVHLRPER